MKSGKGRVGLRGERCPVAKLTNARVIEARIAYAGGADARELASKYGVKRHAMTLAIKGKTFWCVPGAVQLQGHTPRKPPVPPAIEDEIREVRRLYAEGSELLPLAKRLGLPYKVAMDIISGKTYAHLPGAVPVRHSGRRQLSREDVIEARRLYASGKTLTWIAEHFGCDLGGISKTIRGLSHKDIPGAVSTRPTSGDNKTYRGKLSDEQVAESRRLYRGGKSLEAIAADLGVGRNTAWKAISGQTYQDVPRPVLTPKPLRKCGRTAFPGSSARREAQERAREARREARALREAATRSRARREFQLGPPAPRERMDYKEFVAGLMEGIDDAHTPRPSPPPKPKSKASPGRRSGPKPYLKHLRGLVAAAEVPTKEQVEEIVYLYFNRKMSIGQIADKLDIKYKHVHQVVYARLD